MIWSLELRRGFVYVGIAQVACDGALGRRAALAFLLLSVPGPRLRIDA